MRTPVSSEATTAARRRADKAASRPVFPGTDRLLRALAGAGIATAVVSSNAESNVRRILGPELAATVGCYRCGSSLFGKARKMRGLVAEFGVAPAAVLAVGDEVRDIDAAEEVGLVAAAVSWGYASRAALAARRPRFLVDTVEELVALIVPAVEPAALRPARPTP